MFECTGVALPVHNGGFWSRLTTSFTGRSISSVAKNHYLVPALQLIARHLPDINIDLEHLYTDVRLVLWSADTVLRSDFASLTQLLVEVCKMYSTFQVNIIRIIIKMKNVRLMAREIQ